MIGIAIPTKVCSFCGVEKPKTAFSPRSDRTSGIQSECKECKPHIQRKSRYGITREQYDEMVEAQSGVCAICMRSCRTGQALGVDHDHSTGRVRALLCRNCNAGLGNFGENAEMLTTALAYLLQYGEA